MTEEDDQLFTSPVAPISVAAGPNIVSSGPGRRLKNPLGWYASSTYQISLYMMDPKTRDRFVDSGRQDIQGAMLIMQSGGINDENKRAPGFAEDFYVDNLKIKTITGNATQSAAVSTEISFQITEPYGFSFISRLKRAAEELKPKDPFAASGTTNSSENPTKNFFVLGIRFIGYDENGNILTGQEVFPAEKDPLDPRVNKDSTGLFEVFYDVFLTELKYRIDGRATVYNIKAAPIAQYVAFNNKRGRIDNGVKITAGTVREAIDAMFTSVTAAQEDLRRTNKIKEINRYSVEFRGDAAQFIGEASVVVPDDTEKSKWPPSIAAKVSSATDAIGVKSVPSNLKREITFRRDTAILQAIDQIVTLSTFLRDALKVSYTSTDSPDTQKRDLEQTVPNSEQRLSWFSVSPLVKNPRWDPLTADFAFDIVYVIQRYETPMVPAASAKRLPPYPGPHKRYEYWYTGQNTEIIKYEQQLDNNFFCITPDPSISGENGRGGQASIPQVANKSEDQNRQGRRDRSLASQNNVRTNLYDPGSFSNAKITILGDPDYLMGAGAAGTAAGVDKYYEPNGFTINPDTAQILIEVDFKEPYDYLTESTGLMSINEQIQIFPYPKGYDIKGVSFMVIGVESVFSNGKFTQVLDCKSSIFANTVDESANVSSGPNAKGGTGTTGSNGLAINPVVNATAMNNEPVTVTETPQDEP